MKITARMTILFLFAAIVPTAIVGYLGYDIGKQTVLQQTTDYLESTNILKSRQLERWIKSSKTSIEELAQRPLVREYASVMAALHDMSDPAYRRAHRSIIADHLMPRLKYGVFSELFVMCPREGHISASTDEKQDGRLRNNRNYFIEGKSRTYVEGNYYSQTLEQPAMTVSTPVKSADGNMIAVLAGRLVLGELSEIMALGSDKSETLDTYLVNNFNFFVSEPRFGKDYILKKAVRTEGTEAGLSGKEGYGFYKNYRGVPVIGAYKWLPEFRMCIITEIEQQEAFAPVKRLAWITAVCVLAICISACFLGIFLARTISRPLILLAEGAGEIGGGNLEYRIDLNSNDELGDLARATNEMAAKLKETHTSVGNLQKEIDERRLARAALVESEEKYRVLAETARDIILTHDMKGNITYVNDAGLKKTGYKMEEALGKPIFRFIPAEHIDAIRRREALRKAGDTGIDLYEIEFVSHLGERTPMEVCSAPVIRKGKVEEIMIIARDITDRKQAEKRLNEQLIELRRWNEAVMGREMRILDLKREINELLVEAGEPARYASALKESDQC